MGICCSSFVQINAGTSGRDYLVPEGITRHISVSNSNLLVCRHWLGTYKFLKVNTLGWGKSGGVKELVYILFLSTDLFWKVDVVGSSSNLFTCYRSD